MSVAPVSPLLSIRVRLTSPRVPMWTALSADKICSGQPLRITRSIFASIIDGTLERPLVLAFYEGKARYGWLMPGDFTFCLHPMHDDDCPDRCADPETRNS